MAITYIVNPQLTLTFPLKLTSSRIAPRQYCQRRIKPSQMPACGFPARALLRILFPFTHTNHQITFAPLQFLTLSLLGMKELSFLLCTYSCPTITEAESIELNFHFALLATSVCSESIRNKIQISVSPFAPQALQPLHHYYELFRPCAEYWYSTSCRVST